MKPLVSPLPAPRRRLFIVAVFLSFAFLCAFAWLRGGVGATPYETMDSQGRKMGFNDVFSGEHYLIILKNADFSHAVHEMKPHDWLLAAFHPLLILTLLSGLAPWLLKLFLWVQGALFFWGWFGLYILPLAVADVLFLHTSDREGFADIPYISIMSQGAWLWACFFMLWKLRTPRRPAPHRESRATA